MNNSLSIFSLTGSDAEMLLVHTDNCFNSRSATHMQVTGNLIDTANLSLN
jgi:hypothetical protein